MTPDPHTIAAPEPPHTFLELRTTGLLWYINASLFHPRGYALGLVAASTTSEPFGWDLRGDGSEPWYFEPGDHIDAHHRNAQALFDAQRKEKPTP